MRPLPLGQVRFGPRSHLSALWWLGLLYRSPPRFRRVTEKLPRRMALPTTLALYLHAVPSIFLVCVIGRLILYALLHVPTDIEASSVLEALQEHILQIAGGIAFGIAGGISFAISRGIAGGIAVGIAGGIAGGIAFGIAFGITSLRVFYHPLHLLFIWPAALGSHYRLHPVAWDDMCSVPFPGLHRLLLAYAEESPPAADREIERLISGYPSQRLEALRARAALIARRAGRQTDLAQLDDVAARLPEGEKGFLAETRRVREMIAEICRLQTRLKTIDRPILREPVAHLLRTEIENFQHRMAGFHEPLASEFRAAADEWLNIADRQLDQARAVLGKEPTPQVFRAGDPVDHNQEAFVTRDRVVGELEKQVMLATGCPGLLLYGRRRMGKSTVLGNLLGFLPREVRVVTVSMQNPAAFQSPESLLQLLAGEIHGACPDLELPAEPPGDLAAFFRHLTACNDALAGTGGRLLLALDEYENLDEKIGAGLFDNDLLGTLRESIQSHRQLTWVFAGSHEITELAHAPWPSYLISVRTIEVEPFTPAQTRLLLTEPVKHSPMWLGDESRRPRFEPGFWGDGGIERIHAEAAGWPHLVQLIAETAVDLVNDCDARQVSADLMQQALDAAVVRGDIVLRQLTEGESTLPGEWNYLRAFRRQPSQAPPEDETVRRSLERRLLVAEEDDRWRLRVPLMQRWLRLCG